MTQRTRFVLLNTSHGGNVGAAARAMKVMGFDDLVLVQPRFADVLQHADTHAFASGATDVLARARVVPTLADALHGVTWACATAMTPRDFGPPTHSPRAHFSTLAHSAHRVAFVFGAERTGMRNEDVYRCHACLSIPTNPAYGSLNLAQAVQLIAYEWRQACGGFEGGPGASSPSAVTPPAPPAPAAEWADAAAVHGLLQHWQQTLVQIGFLDPAAPKKLMPRLQQLAHRALLTTDEVHILRGIARAAATTAAAGTAADASQAKPGAAGYTGKPLKGPPCSADSKKT